MVTGRWVNPQGGKVTLAVYAKDWLAVRPNLRPRTRELYEGLLRLHISPTLGRSELAKLTPLIVRRWHAGLSGSDGPGPSTVAKSYRLLRTIMGTAVKDELVVRNPCAVEGAGIEHAAERPALTAEQVWDLADAVEPRFRALVLTAALTGLRKGELLGLTRARVDLLHKTITVVEQVQQLADGTLIVGPPKTAAGQRTIAVPAILAMELEQHLATYAPPGSTALVSPARWEARSARTSGRPSGRQRADASDYRASTFTICGTSL